MVSPMLAGHTVIERVPLTSPRTNKVRNAAIASVSDRRRHLALLR